MKAEQALTLNQGSIEDSEHQIHASVSAEEKKTVIKTERK